MRLVRVQQKEFGRMPGGGSVMDKDLRAFVKQMTEKGYTLELLRKNNHYVFKASRNGRSMLLTMSKTAADHRAFKNAKALLQRGLGSE